MLELIRKFLRDPDFATARIRALLFAVGTLFTQGIVTLDILSEKLGPIGWWVGVSLVCISVAIKAGGTGSDQAKPPS